METAVAYGITLGADVAGIEVDGDVLDRHAARRDPRNALTRAAFLGPARRPGREQLAHLAGLRWRDRPRLAWAFLFPPADYRAY
ncbi:MAG: hypothetical protein P8J50_08735 [Acidimicrobiales bacterium]|nr:hypothetical protein [Acidimicrobiales bacterium]